MRILLLALLPLVTAGLASRLYAQQCTPTLTDFTVSKGAIYFSGSDYAVGTVNIYRPPCAQNSNIAVALSASSGMVTLPNEAIVSPPLESASFDIKTGWPSPSQPTPVTITASLNGASSSVSVTMMPLTPTLTVSPGSVTYGGNQQLTGTISIPVPAGGGGWSSFDIESSSPDDPHAGVTVPSSFSIPVGQTSGTFSINYWNYMTQPSAVTVTAVWQNPSVTSSASALILPTGESVNASNLGPCKSCAAQAGAPINLATGNVWIQEQDYSLPGLAGGLKLVRTWNSQWQDNSPISPAGMFGNSWWSTYEERLQVLSSDDVVYWRGDGSAWTFSYNSSVHTYALASPSDERATLQFNPVAGQFDLTLADGSQRIFSQPGYLLAMIDRNGNATNFTYDSSNRLIQATDAAGTAMTFTYGDPNNVNQVTSAHDSVGTIANYSYDSSSRLIQVTYPDGSTLNFTYDPTSSMITSVTDAQGKVIEAHTYDSLHRGLTSQKANGFDLVTVSYPGYGQTQLSDSMGDTTAYGYEFIDGRMFMTSVTGPGCSSCGGRGNSAFTYDALGNLTSSTDALGHTTNYTYDTEGNVLSKSVQLNANTTLTWSYTYNSFNEALTVTDPLGNVTTNTYDADGNLLTTTTPSPGGNTPGSATSFAYDAKGELTKVTDPLGNATALSYTPAGLVATITDAQKNATSFQYDGRGNRISMKDPLGNTTAYSYDPMSRLKQITYPDGSTMEFAYDDRGRRISTTDANGKTTSYGYDDADHLTSATDAAGNLTAYGYDTENRLASITDASGRVTNFAYDSLGRVTQVTFPSTLTDSYTYDADGNLLSKTDRNGKTINYTYDALNRLVSKSYPDSTAVSYTYDNLSHLTQVTDPTGTYSFTYDNMDRLTSATDSYSFLGGANEAVGYTYDAASNRLSMTNPQGGATQYLYDTLNRLTSLTDPQSNQFTFAYDALSRRTSLTRPNGVTTAYGYDTLSHLLSILHQAGNNSIDGTEYTYDPAGNRTSKTQLPSGTVSNYGYDALYELTQVTQGANTTEAYTYDPVGNRLSSAKIASYSYNSSNELTADSSATYTYDSNGNTLTETDSAGTTKYTWDFENRLTSVTLPGTGGTVNFKYDPFGRRIEKIGPNGTTVYVYDGDNEIEELDGAGSVTSNFTQSLGIDEPLAMYEGGASYYYEADGLGSITSLSDSTGKAVQTYTYDSFGDVTASTGSVTSPFQFTARELDSETGLYYYRARYYDASTGRFLSEDPMRFGSDANFYRYVDGSPINFADPFGLYWVYCVNSGVLFHVDPRTPGAPRVYVGRGYAGNGPGLNNPGMEDVQNVGPLPEHVYRIGPKHTIVTNTGITLKGAMRLTPAKGPALPNHRGGFIIHGDNISRNHTASEGCPVFGPAIRNQIAKTGDDEFRVVNCAKRAK